ncbi:helix-turn-helix domain-containing protein [Brevibacterium picturae]|uniref:Winged helix-turn-helix transcriptional regulator n=1 Tax=Brevibacterium picturae TaxID=260553 RepID=A0ABP4LU19_9MICO
MRTYADACGITRALDVIGERWAIPVIRELLFGPRRYSDLAAALPGVSTNILSSRLRELTEAGVVAKRRLPRPAAATVYELTSWGVELEPTLISLGRWAAGTAVDPEEQTLSPSSFALSLKTTFDPVAAAEVTMDVRLVMDDDVFDSRVSAGTFAIRRSLDPGSNDPRTGRQPTTGQSMQVSGHPQDLADAVYGNADLAAPTILGEVRLDGAPGLFETFASCFSIPPLPTEGPS